MTGPSTLNYAPAINEIQRLTFNATGNAVVADPINFPNLHGSADARFQLKFGTTTGNKELTYLEGVSPTADDVIQALGSIVPDLFDLDNNVSNVIVTGNPGGPFDIQFVNQQAGKPIGQFITVVPTGPDNADSAVTTPRTGQSSLPLASDVQTYLNTTLLNNIVGGTGNATVIGPAGGPFMIAFNGGLSGYDLPTLSATTATGVTATFNAVQNVPTDVLATNGNGNESQVVTVTGSGNLKLSFNGVASDAPDLTVTANTSPTAQDVLTHLTTGVLASNLAGNVAVLGKNGGPFTVLFNNSLSYSNVGLIAKASGAAGATVTATDGGKILPAQLSANTATGTPTLGQVQTYLQKIANLGTNVNVFGPNGGPFTLVYSGSLAFTPASELNLTTQVTGGTAPVASVQRRRWQPQHRQYDRDARLRRHSERRHLHADGQRPGDGSDSL